MERDFEKDILVNKFKLDVDCAEHSGIYLYWARELAKAKTNLDRATNSLKLTQGERSLAVRALLENEGLKTTESMVESRLLTDVLYQKAKEEVLDAQRQVYELEAGVRAMEHRRDELSNLVHLWSKGYYSLPEGAGIPKPTGNDSYSGDIRRGLNSKEEA